MWISILINIIISILIILIIHYLWEYLKDKYSEKSTRDILGYQTQKYKNIIEDLQKNRDLDCHKDILLEPFTSDFVDNDLKEDLESFLRDSIDN